MPDTGKAAYKITDIGAVSDLATASVAVGDSGIVVGSSDGTPGFEWIPTAANGTSGHTVELNVFGSPFVLPTGVNARGDVVGIYEAASGQTHGFLLHNGKATDIGTLGGPSSVANAINNQGLVVGASETASGSIDAAAFDGKLHDLGTASGKDHYSEAFSVNALGIAAGRSGLAPDQAQATLFVNGHNKTIGTLGGTTSAATDVNDLGIVVGFSQLTSGAEHAFIYPSLLPGAKPVDLGTLGGMNSIAGSINDLGFIVGQADTTSTATTGLPDAFVEFLGTKMLDLNALIPAAAQAHWDLVQAISINERGQIAGIGLEDGAPHAFLLTLS